jgi:hypothetical protein
MSADTDAMLRNLLAAPERAPDEAFALRIERLVRAEQTLRAARRAAWRRFAIETIAVASLLAAYLLIRRLAGADSGGGIAPLGPATPGILLLLLWICVSIRPDSGVRNR